MATSSAAIPSKRPRVDAGPTHRRPKGPPSCAAPSFPVTMESFLREILAWDFPDAMRNGCHGSNPEAASLAVPERFSNAIEYQRAWFPLCLEELRAQAVSEVSESGPGPEQEVNLLSAPGSNGPILKLIASLVRPSDAGAAEPAGASRHAGQARGGTRRFPAELMMPSQLVLLSTVKNPLQASTAEGSHCLALTTMRVRDSVELQVHRSRWNLHGQANMFATPLTSLVSAVREFTALLEVRQAKLLPHLLAAEKRITSGGASSEASLSQRAPETRSEGILDGFNESQRAAIEDAATQKGFTLVKGPPGTGKTSTLIMLLNTLHRQEYQRFYDEVLRVAESNDSDADTELALLQFSRMKPRILVSGPSNTAVDNIVLRIIERGFVDNEGKRYNPSLIRFGRSAGDGTRAVWLEAMVKDILNEPENRIKARLEELHTEMTRLVQDSRHVRSKLRALVCNVPPRLPVGWEARITDLGDGRYGAYFVDHISKTTQMTAPPGTPCAADDGVPITSMPEHKGIVNELMQCYETLDQRWLEKRRLSYVYEHRHTQGEGQIRQHLETSFLDSAQVVCTTLNGAGHDCMGETMPFNIVIIDEAAQAVEMSTLIPLQLGPSRCVLVGDPQQLPATTFARGGKLSHYQRSLFERLERCGHTARLLDTQYRMHPAISYFPRTIFYGSDLKDGENVCGPSWHRQFHSCAAFRPFTFLNLNGNHRSAEEGPRSNAAEAALAFNVFRTLKRLGERPKGDSISGRVGLVTPYRDQLRVLRRVFAGHEHEVEINTVDGYQGREKDVIIMSCVRAVSPSAGIGFLADIRRMNVALTRARVGLFVVGCEQALRVNEKWAMLIEHARETGALVHVPSPDCDLERLQAARGSKAAASSPEEGEVAETTPGVTRI